MTEHSGNDTKKECEGAEDVVGYIFFQRGIDWKHFNQIISVQIILYLL